MKKAVALALTTLFASSAFAGATDPGFYVGGGFGLTESKLDNLDYTFLPSLKGDRAFKVYGGYQFNRIVALEGGYTKYGKFSDSHLNGYSWNPSALSLAANLGYTFDIGLRPFATLGLSYLGLNEEGYKAFENDSGTAFRYGLGLEYAPQQIDGLAVRMAYEADAFSIQEPINGTSTTFSVGSFYLGASYKF
ncbi:porin family protein [Vibrio hangzhouensis]|uniref:porin family protein n=1 Tax=Vibrio hangzhouensis TaxID=462991 RepID=UPI001C95208E|nr:porin family protein [Vibrio hangzhouensis]MBY6196129.1 porin family protein [Vibrio hangzhouensis]